MGWLRGDATHSIPSRIVGSAWMLPCLVAGKSAEGSVVFIAEVGGTVAAMEIVVVVLVAAGAKGAGVTRAAAGEFL
jgi:hypothetical protein